MPASARDKGSIPGSRRPPGGGHSSSLHYPCLENPMDRGVWRATVHGIAKSWTRPKRLSTHAHVTAIISISTSPHSLLLHKNESACPPGSQRPTTPSTPIILSGIQVSMNKLQTKKRKVYSKMLLSTLRSQKAEYSQGPSELLTPLGCGPSPNYKSLSAQLSRIPESQHPPFSPSLPEAGPWKGGTQDFPGGTVDKNLPANAGDTGSIPGKGRFHLPRSN